MKGLSGDGRWTKDLSLWLAGYLASRWPVSAGSSAGSNRGLGNGGKDRAMPRSTDQTGDRERGARLVRVAKAPGAFTLHLVCNRSDLAAANRGLVHCIQQVLRVAVVVGVQRPHEGAAQPACPIGVPNASEGREFIVVGNVAGRAIGPQQIGDQRDWIVISLPSLLVD